MASSSYTCVPPENQLEAKTLLSREDNRYGARTHPAPAIRTFINTGCIEAARRIVRQAHAQELPLYCLL